MQVHSTDAKGTGRRRTKGSILIKWATQKGNGKVLTGPQPNRNHPNCMSTTYILASEGGKIIFARYAPTYLLLASSSRGSNYVS